MKELKKEIEQLKKEKNAVLMAHYYVDDDVQEIADYVGGKRVQRCDLLCRSQVHGRKCKDLESGEDCGHAGRERGLSDGPYGGY